MNQINYFMELQPPQSTANGWKVSCIDNAEYVLYEDYNVYGTVLPFTITEYFYTKTLAYTASANYYTKHGRSYPYDIVNETTIEPTGHQK